ncbi:MAG: cytochrome P450 [Anaerolineae bacterium]|nr:cytochrome P450 [Anaerolineae bacterium]
MIDVLHPRIPTGPRGLALLKLLADYYRNPLDALANVTAQYGEIVLFKVSSYTVYQIAQPDHIKHVLQDNNRNYRMSGSFDQTRPVVGHGLSTNEGDSWLFHRRLMQPLFGRGQVAVFAPMIAQATAAMFERWRASAATGRSLALYPELLALNHHILGKLLFNVDVTGADRRVLDALNFVRTYTNQRINTLVNVPSNWPTLRNRRFWESVNLLDDFAYGLIREARAGNRQTDDLLSMMLTSAMRKPASASTTRNSTTNS